MKYFLQIILSFFLALNLIAPSVISLIDFDENMELVLELNEDDSQKENKEGEKESSDKDTFYHDSVDPFSTCLTNNSGNITFYVEGWYHPELNIILPPPELS